MRAVLDTNILVSALIAPAGNPATIYDAWEDGYIHGPDLRGTTRRTASHATKAKGRQAHQTIGPGAWSNQVKKLTEFVGPLARQPQEPSPDPGDDFLLARQTSAKPIIW